MGPRSRRGVGRDISVARQAGYLADWMREVGLGGAVIVGHDLGGGVAQILAVHYPELVRGLVFANSICYDNWPILPVRAIRTTGAVSARLPDPVFRLVYTGFLLGLHDDRGVARESAAEHLTYYERTGGAAASRRRKLVPLLLTSLHSGITAISRDYAPPSLRGSRENRAAYRSISPAPIGD